MEYHFDFCVSGLTDSQAEALMGVIISIVGMVGGSMGGGFAPVSADDTAEERGVEGQDEQTDAE